MGSLSNGALCNGGTNKRHLEGAHLTSSSMPKYKRRKVSAVRDFPPGCGSNSSKIGKEKLVEDEKEMNGFVVNCFNSTASEGGDVSYLCEELKSPPEMETSESLDNLVDKVVSAAGMANGDDAGSPIKPLGDDFWETLQIDAPEFSNDFDKVAPSEFSNDFDKVVAATVVKSDDVTDGKSDIEISPMAVELPPPIDKKVVAQYSSISDDNIVKVPTLKKQYPRRRVSAIREFPPFCGRNAPCPTEEERAKITTGDKALSEPVKALQRCGESREIAVAKEEQVEANVRDGNYERSELTEISIVQEEVLKADGKDKNYNNERIVPELMTTLLSSDKQGGASVETVVKAEIDDSYVSEARGSGIEELARQNDSPKRKLEVRRPQKASREDYKDDRDTREKVSKDIVVYNDKIDIAPCDDSVAPCDDFVGCDDDRVMVVGLMAAPNCPWRPELKHKKEEESKSVSKVKISKDDDSGGKSLKKRAPSYRKVSAKKKSTAVNVREFNAREQDEVFPAGSEPKKFETTSLPIGPSSSGEDNVHDKVKTIKEDDLLVGKSSRKRPPSSRKISGKKEGSALKKEGESDDPKQDDVFSVGPGPNEFEVTLPPYGPNGSSGGNMRNKVRETLRLFQAICRKLLQGEEANVKQQGKAARRIDLQASNIIRSRGKEVNTSTQIIGAVPGVEVGDEFQYRVELALVGIHRLYQAGIDYMKHGGMIICTSIVASGGYADDLDNPDVLIYSGQGGNAVGKDKQPEDQKLERGNLALKNSITAKNPVRVIRGTKEKASNSDAKSKMVPSYAYDGLYIVEKYWHEVGQNGKLVFKFELRRIPGQPELAWKEIKKSKKFKIREGVCVDDISNGKELFRICAVNTVDNEKPPAFNYITKVRYPNWYSPTPPKGCGCVDGCSDSQKCSCVLNNGEEIPYNHNGAIVEAKTLVYECGPSCKCPPSCHNRVTQHGIKIQLEIFKTASRGWGVRSLSSIPSGSFICEYIGDLLEDKEAEQRSNDEYLFDIGKNYSDCSHLDALSTNRPEEQTSLDELVEDSGFTIDAAVYGNVGRFINHSCSPNLYAQNVLHDHEDKSMPHIMFFAAENIPPLQELTYHYNYSVDQVRDSNGNIKKKSCYCGSEECTGRMY